MAQPESAAIDTAGGDPRLYQELWFALSRREWSSLVLVPVDPGASTERVAHALAEVGKRLSEAPVSAVTAASLEYGTAMALADLPRFVDRTRLLATSQWPTVDLPAGAVEEIKDGDAEPATQEAMVLSSSAKVIISIPPVVTEPLGLATTRKADLIVLCVEIGRTRVANARRAVELIGRERLAGCLMLR